MNDPIDPTETLADREDEGDDRARAGKVIDVPSLILIPAALVAFFFLVEHAYGAQGARFPDHPSADAVTLAWFAAVLVVVLVPYAEKIGIPGSSVTFRRNIERTAASAVAATNDLESARKLTLSTLRDWAQSAAQLTPLLERYGRDQRAVADLVIRYTLELMNSAKPSLVSADELVRLSLWWYFAENDVLAFVAGTDKVDEITENATFAPGDGLMGQAFIEGRIRNYADATAEPYYRTHRSDPPYRGLLLVPLRDGATHVMGMLSIDRKKGQRFDETAVTVAEILAELVAIAYLHPIVMANLPDFRAATGEARSEAPSDQPG